MFRRDIAVLMVVALAMFGLLAHYAVKGQDIPIWQALLVGFANLFAAGKLFLTVKKTKDEQRRAQAEKVVQRNPR